MILDKIKINMEFVVEENNINELISDLQKYCDLINNPFKSVEVFTTRNYKPHKITEQNLKFSSNKICDCLAKHEKLSTKQLFLKATKKSISYKMFYRLLIKKSVDGIIKSEKTDNKLYWTLIKKNNNDQTVVV